MFKFTKHELISDIIFIEPQVFIDDRGFFMETYNKREFESVGINFDFVQDSNSNSKKGVFRGFHFQIDEVQSKLVRVAKGSVLDFAIDLRRKSPTYGTYITEFLSGENKKQLYIPKGFAHGFLSLEDETELSYKWDKFYNPKLERGIIYNDPSININWDDIKLKYNINDMIISNKDKNNITLKEFEKENKF